MMSTDSNKGPDKRSALNATVPFNENQEVEKDIDKILVVQVDIEKDNSRTRHTKTFNKPTPSSQDAGQSTHVPLDLDKQQGDKTDKRSVSNDNNGADKMQMHTPIELPIKQIYFDQQIQHGHLQYPQPVPNLNIDSDKLKRDSKDERLMKNVPIDKDTKQDDYTIPVPDLPLNLSTEHDYQNFESPVPKVLRDNDKQQVHSLNEKPIPTTHLDSDRNQTFLLLQEKGDHQEFGSKQNILYTEEKQNEQLQDNMYSKILDDVDSHHKDLLHSLAMASNISNTSDQQHGFHKNTQRKVLKNVIYDIPLPVHENNILTAVENKSHDNMPNAESLLVPGGTNQSSFPNDVTSPATLVLEQMEPLNKSTEKEQPTYALLDKHNCNLLQGNTARF